MARLFDRNMFIIMIAIMMGVIVVTFFIADIVNQSKIDIINEEHIIEIGDINSKNEEFTKNFLQGSVILNDARENREEGNIYYFDAHFWYTNALVKASVYFVNNWVNATTEQLEKCILNCEESMALYTESNLKFSESRPYFEKANTIELPKNYSTALGYYVNFSFTGERISLLRYNASYNLKKAAETLYVGDFTNASLFYGNYSLFDDLYNDLIELYNEQKEQINTFLFFSEDREAEYPE